VRALKHRYVQFLAFDQCPQIQAEKIPQEQFSKGVHFLREAPFFTALSQEVRIAIGKKWR
jgi:hypothetical protein